MYSVFFHIASSGHVLLGNDESRDFVSSVYISKKGEKLVNRCNDIGHTVCSTQSVLFTVELGRF